MPDQTHKQDLLVLLGQLNVAFSALGDDPDYLADVVARAAGDPEAESLRDLFQAVGQLLDGYGLRDAATSVGSDRV